MLNVLTDEEKTLIAREIDKVTSTVADKTADSLTQWKDTFASIDFSPVNTDNVVMRSYFALLLDNLEKRLKLLKYQFAFKQPDDEVLKDYLRHLFVHEQLFKQFNLKDILHQTKEDNDDVVKVDDVDKVDLKSRLSQFDVDSDADDKSEFTVPEVKSHASDFLTSERDKKRLMRSEFIQAIIDDESLPRMVDHSENVLKGNDLKEMKRLRDIEEKELESLGRTKLRSKKDVKSYEKIERRRKMLAHGSSLSDLHSFLDATKNKDHVSVPKSSKKKSKKRKAT